MRKLSFLHHLKLAAIALTLLAACVAACLKPDGSLKLIPVSETVFDNPKTLHIGNGQHTGTAYQNVDKEGQIAVRVREDQPLLYLKYNVKSTDRITLRLYDQEGSLQHIEKIMNVYKGMEKSLDLGHLPEGIYQLQVRTEKGLTISQPISLHTNRKI